MDIKLNLFYYASIILHAFIDLLCSKLCWHNRPGPNIDYTDWNGGVNSKICYFIEFLMGLHNMMTF